MTKARKIFAVHPVEILKTEFRGPMGVSGRALAKAFNLSAIYEVVRGERVIRAGYGGAVVRPVLRLFWMERPAHNSGVATEANL